MKGHQIRWKIEVLLDEKKKGSLWWLSIIIISLLMSFSQHQLMVFHWSLSDSKSPQVSRMLLSILADLNNAVVCMVLILSPISSSSSPLFKLLDTVPSTMTIIFITVTFMFYSFFSSLVRSFCLTINKQIGICFTLSILMTVNIHISFK